MQIFSILSLIHVSAEAAESKDASLLFQADFDKYSAQADYAAGSAEPVYLSKDLSLRMFPGPQNQGNAVKLLSSEKLGYYAEKNINPKQGTVSFWLSPQKWDSEKKGLHTFFEVNFGQYVMTVYESDQYKRLRFVFAQTSPKYWEPGFVSFAMKKAQWAKGNWHKIDAVWNNKQMALYVDGVLARPEYPYWPNPRKFKKEMIWPDMRKGQIMSFGWGSKNKRFMKEETAFDRVKIYDRALSAAEIKLNYEKEVPQSRKVFKVPELTVPQGKMIVPDGVLNDAEWSDAACIVLRNTEKKTRWKSLQGKLYVKQTADHFLLGLEADGGKKSTITGNDVSDIWQDDSFELHMMTKDLQRYQFIINSLGAVFDVKSKLKDGKYDLNLLDSKWNSGIKRAVKRGKDKWYLEIVLPKKNIGAQGDVKANFCLSGYDNGPEFVCWGTDCSSYGDATRFGTLHFSGSGKTVRMKKCMFENGAFHLDLAPDISAWIVTASGKTYPKPSGKEKWDLELPEGVYQFSAKDKALGSIHFQSEMNQPA